MKGLILLKIIDSIGKNGQMIVFPQKNDARPITGFVGNPGHNILNKNIKKHELKIHVCKLIIVKGTVE